MTDTPEYDIFGLLVQSELALPELPAGRGAAPDVTIRRGQIARREAAEPVGLSPYEDGFLLNVPSVARFLVNGGTTITVDRSEGGSERNIRLYLLGSAFGILLHQRGLLPLHANAIDIGGEAIAFMGHSGAGKSTLAAAFHERGYRILADDVSVVTDIAALPVVHSGVPRARLWRDALEHMGLSADSYERSFDADDKYDVPMPPREGAAALRLRAVYVLQKEEGGEPAIQPLLGVEAADALIANTYRGGYVHLLGQSERHFLQCMTLVRKVPVFRFGRPWGHGLLDRGIASVLGHLDQLRKQSEPTEGRRP